MGLVHTIKRRVCKRASDLAAQNREQSRPELKKTLR